MLTAYGKPILGLITILLAFSFACHEEPAPPPGPAPGDHIWTTADGNSMPYTIGGNSDAEVTVVFVHCWMCDSTFWDSQLPVLADKYRTVTLDLPGHGEATSERADWTVGAYGDDVAGLIRELGLSRVVLVGHSMGGPVSLRVAAQLPGKVLGIVAVDTLHDAEFKFDGEKVQAFVQAFEEDFVGTCERFVGQMLPEEGIEDVKAHIRTTGCAEGNGEVGVALMRNYSTIDIPKWFSEAGVPIRAINAAGPNETKVELNRAYADYDAVLMEGVGHYPHMTRPEEFNELLLETLSELCAAAPRPSSE